MPALILSAKEVHALLDFETCIEAVAGALRELAQGRAANPLRVPMRLANGGILGWMPAHLLQENSLGFKAVHVVPGNEHTPYDCHQGVVVLFDPEHGLPQAVLDASAITSLRTAAASALATRELAREEASVLALLGSGVQAHSHLLALSQVRSVRAVRVFSRTPENRRAFAERASAQLGLDVRAADSARAAVEGADLVCTTTSSRVPVLEGRWLAPGTHVNAVGACVPTARELDTDAVQRARVFVDRRESAEHEAGDLLIPRSEGAIRSDHVAGELGDVLLGRVAGRTSGEEITLFKSLGIAVEDLAAARVCFERALARGIGTQVELGGRRP